MITGISYSFDKKQIYHHGEPVESIDRKLALLKFIEFISAHNSLVLVGHNISTYDSHILCKQLQQNNILTEFLRLIIGCTDTLKCSRKKMLEITSNKTLLKNSYDNSMKHMMPYRMLKVFMSCL